MRALDGVTLVSVTGVNSDAALAAMQRSMSTLIFDRAMLISTDKPSVQDPRVEWRQIPPMTLVGYSAFVLKELHQHIETQHALIVQADGFVVNPELWDDDWLAFDYIGAPWPPIIKVGPYNLRLVNRVGNGGFSLRSRKLLEMTSLIDLRSVRFPTKAEDVVICHLLYYYLLDRGIQFADTESAMRFSVEHPQSATHSIKTAFGFHGTHHAEEVDRLAGR